MYSNQIKCKFCKTESEVQEENLMFEGIKKIEAAYCPNCNKKIFEAKTDGWFSVKRAEFERKEDLECTYPMP